MYKPWNCAYKAKKMEKLGMIERNDPIYLSAGSSAN